MTTGGLTPGRAVPAAILLAGLLAVASWSQSEGPAAHIAIENPADLSKAEAHDIYRNLKEQMATGYALSGLDFLDGYQTWRNYNDAPYISATHGRRFVNNYANATARDYGTLKPGDRLPLGSVLAKDSMTVTDQGRTFPGALFVMEKLPEGRSPATADWRYVMVLPDGSLFGDTVGEHPEAVAYCHGCHEAVANRDYTFFVPGGYRVAE